jgi:hypothetical protein
MCHNDAQGIGESYTKDPGFVESATLGTPQNLIWH